MHTGAQSVDFTRERVHIEFGCSEHAMELGHNSDMRRIVPTDPLLAPQPKSREKTLDRLRTAPPTKAKCTFYTYTCGPQ